MGSPVVNPSSPATGNNSVEAPHPHLQAISEKVFNWTNEDHRKAAEYADQRAKELRDSQAGPRLLKGLDQSGRIADLEQSARYHRSKISGNDSQSADQDTSPGAAKLAYRKGK